jgi:hypothetical protein
MIMCFAEKEDGDEEGRGHKRKRKQLKSSIDEKSLSISIVSQQSNLMNVHWCFTGSSPKRPKSDGEGKSKKYGKPCLFDLILSFGY